MEIEAEYRIINSIYQYIGELASDITTMSTDYAYFISLRIHISDHKEISNESKNILDGNLLLQWN